MKEAIFHSEINAISFYFSFCWNLLGACTQHLCSSCFAINTIYDKIHLNLPAVKCQTENFDNVNTDDFALSSEIWFLTGKSLPNWGNTRPNNVETRFYFRVPNEGSISDVNSDIIIYFQKSSSLTLLSKIPTLNDFSHTNVQFVNQVPLCSVCLMIALLKRGYNRIDNAEIRASN